MPENIVSNAGVVASTGGILYKILVYLVGPIMASIVVLMMTPPATTREFIASFISTVFCSIGFGAYVVTRLFVPFSIVDETSAALAGGVYFVCGLPGWFIVKAIFFTLDHHKNRTVMEIVKDIRDIRTEKDRNDKEKDDPLK